jgi:predicted transcriptional regulator
MSEVATPEMTEDVISGIMSRKSLKIIKYLYTNDYATFRILERKLKIDGKSARKYVELLSKYGIVKVNRVGRAYVIMLNRGGKYTKAILSFLAEVGYL